jgi:hypothetical protein
VVIDIIDIVGASLIESENDSPVCADGNGVKAFSLAFQRVELESRQIHVRDCSCRIQPRQNIPQLAGMFGIDAARIVVLVETPQPFVTNRPNHGQL